MRIANIIFMTNKRIFCRAAMQLEIFMTKREFNGEILFLAESSTNRAPDYAIDNINKQDDHYELTHNWPLNDKIGFYAVRSP